MKITDGGYLNMKTTHEVYLKRILSSKKVELREHNVVSRIEIANANLKSRMLQEQIDSIEKQLEDTKEE